MDLDFSIVANQQDINNNTKMILELLIYIQFYTIIEDSLNIAFHDTP